MRRYSLIVTLVVVLAATASVPAQNPPATQAGPRGAGPGGQASAQPPAPGGQRGRGRGAIQVMTLTTPAWASGGAIPLKYSQAGDEVSPPLMWSGVPEGTASFVLVVHDIDALSGASLQGTLHWLVWNIPGTAVALPEGVAQGTVVAGDARQISVTGPNYRGPAAPATGPPHHYVFELFALDELIAVPATITSPAETRAAVMAAMAGHVRGKATLVGTFKRAEK